MQSQHVLPMDDNIEQYDSGYFDNLLQSQVSDSIRYVVHKKCLDWGVGIVIFRNSATIAIHFDISNRQNIRPDYGHLLCYITEIEAIKRRKNSINYILSKNKNNIFYRFSSNFLDKKKVVCVNKLRSNFISLIVSPDFFVYDTDIEKLYYETCALVKSVPVRYIFREKIRKNYYLIHKYLDLKIIVREMLIQQLDFFKINKQNERFPNLEEIDKEIQNCLNIIKNSKRQIIKIYILISFGITLLIILIYFLSTGF